MDKLHFYKLSGTGNDFIIINNLNNSRSFDYFKSIVRAVTNRNNGVGADGLIIINPDNETDFRWDFFNADGSVAEMCGNGARCVARVFSYITGKSEMIFKTLAGRIDAYVTGSRVKVRLSDPNDILDHIEINLDGTIIKGSFINTGVPHFVVPVDNIDDYNVREIGRKLRFHEYFAPKGTNVNFVKYLGDSAIKVRTYERGVEDETLACGTGACATALIFGRKGVVKDRADIITSGGERLSVYFSIQNDLIHNVYLEGNTRFICEGEVFLNEIF